jgi:hypothetical protein
MNSICSVSHKHVPFVQPATPPSDYVAMIKMGATFVGGVTKDKTNTYTLFTDHYSTTFTNRGWVTSLNANQTNETMRLEAPAQYLFCPSYTYSLWFIATTTLSTRINGLVCDYLQSANSFFLYTDTNSFINVTHGSLYTDDVLKSARPVILNDWVHVTITYNNTTKLITMYINGYPVSSKTKSSTWTGFGSTTGGKVIFGALPWVVPGFGLFPGYLDSMRLYARELPANEVLKIYLYENTYKIGN